MSVSASHDVDTGAFALTECAPARNKLFKLCVSLNQLVSFLFCQLYQFRTFDTSILDLTEGHICCKHPVIAMESSLRKICIPTNMCIQFQGYPGSYSLELPNRSMDQDSTL